VSGFYPPRKLFKFIKLLAVQHGGLPVSGAREATAFGLCPTFSRLRRTLRVGMPLSSLRGHQNYTQFVVKTQTQTTRPVVTKTVKINLNQYDPVKTQ